MSSLSPDYSPLPLTPPDYSPLLPTARFPPHDPSVRVWPSVLLEDAAVHERKQLV